MKTVLAGWLALLSTVASAGPVVVVLRTAAPVPALDEGGLMILAVVVGGVAGWAVRRRNQRK